MYVFCVVHLINCSVVSKCLQPPLLSFFMKEKWDVRGWQCPGRDYSTLGIILFIIKIKQDVTLFSRMRDLGELVNLGSQWISYLKYFSKIFPGWWLKILVLPLLAEDDCSACCRPCQPPACRHPPPPPLQHPGDPHGGSARTNRCWCSRYWNTNKKGNSKNRLK